MAGRITAASSTSPPREMAAAAPPAVTHILGGLYRGDIGVI